MRTVLLVSTMLLAALPLVAGPATACHPDPPDPGLPAWAYVGHNCGGPPGVYACYRVLDETACPLTLP